MDQHRTRLPITFGTALALTDSSGNITSSLSYDSFGNVTSGSASTLYTYTGCEADADIGVLYYRARFYNPRLGRFISEDPIAFAGGDINLYTYVFNNPVKFFDPEGTQGRSDRNFYPTDKNPKTGGGYGAFGDVPRGCPEGGWGPVGALGDFWSNYVDMRSANTVGADKYFHCRANCEAARRGTAARVTARVISEVREIFDEYIKGYPTSDCEQGRRANSAGRLGGSGCRPCSQVCARFRPTGLTLPQPQPSPKPNNSKQRSWGGGR